MNYNYQLNNIATQYRKFSKGQRVEETQFNEFLDFFEDQDRLSRVMLKGVGIVCGFQAQPVYVNKQLNSIQLSQGVAITTDGDLLTLNKKSKTIDLNADSYMSELKDVDLQNKLFTHFKVYDNEKALYPAFHINNNPDKQIELWELATTEEAKTGFQPLAGLGNFDDKYLLLYLESYEKEVKPCRGVDCDNHGIQQIRNLKVLVATLPDIEKILAKDKVAPERILLGSALNEIKQERVILTPGLGTQAQLKQAYKNVVSRIMSQGMFSGVDLISELIDIPLVNRANFISTVNQLADQGTHFQYAYDVLNDLADTYAEIVKLVPVSFTKCYPDLGSFPKHVILGKIIPTNVSDFRRHKFYNAPILDDKKTTLRLEVLIARFNQLIFDFRNPTNVGGGMNITPSRGRGLLDYKAIPGYYNSSDNLQRLWNFDKTSNRTFKTNLGYDRSNLAENLHVQMPLDYNMDNKTHFVIEGHQGVDYREVMEYVKRNKDTKQLGFEVMAVSLAQLADNKDFYKADFVDYVTKNPGLEHRNSVPKGGTFVVVYKSESDPYVIADFALPYVCCTPKSNVSLSLPSATICKDAKPMAFTVVPSNGEVKADVASGLTGGVVKVNGQYLFNPATVEAALQGQEIHFTVNGKPTSCKVKVVPNPNIVVHAVAFEYPEGDSTRTTVTFNTGVANGLGYEYQWDFLGNGSYVALQPDTLGNVKYTYFNINPNMPVNVLITANGCSQHFRLTDWYVTQPVETGTPPTVSLTASHMNLFVPGGNSVKIYREVTPGTGTISDSSYIWTCNDPNVVIYGPAYNPVGITFPYAGVFTIKLTVRDSNNLEGFATIVFDVKTQASITSLTVNPSAPTTNDIIVLKAVTNNPSGIQGLQYEWYLEGEPLGRSTSNTHSFTGLPVGEYTLGARLVDSDGGYHSHETHTVVVNIHETNMRGGTSFLANTLITMFDGSKKKIQEVVAGDRLKSKSGIVSVINTVNYMDEVRLYRLNDVNHFITGPHPVGTNEGWKSFDPEKTRQFVSSVPVNLLQVENLILKEDGKHYPLLYTDYISGQYRVYNLEVSGTSRDYYANGYSVYSEIEPLQ